MATLVQLQSEVWWSAEYQPPAIYDLCAKLRDHYNVDAFALGSKGDQNHLYGYHRSAAWVLNSRYCTNRSYSVSETPGNRDPGDENWLCAVDATLPGPELIAACQRLDAAVRSGRLEKITEWYGNDDGDQRVDGYDNVRNAVATSDDSHLWHLHMGFDRGRANENHDDLFAVLTGTQGDDDMPKLIRVNQTGLIAIGNGPAWYRLPSPDAVAAAQRIWGLADPLPIDQADLVAFGVDVSTLVGDGDSGAPAVLVPHTHAAGETGPAQPE